MKDTSGGKVTEHRSLGPSRMLRYGGFGVVGVALDYGVFIFLLSRDVAPFLGSGIGYLSGTLFTFAANAVVTFGMSDRILLRAGKFFAIAVVSAAMSSLMLWLVGTSAVTGDLVTRIIVTAPFLVGQYVANRRWTFA